MTIISILGYIIAGSVLLGAMIIRKIELRNARAKWEREFNNVVAED